MPSDGRRVASVVIEERLATTRLVAIVGVAAAVLPVVRRLTGRSRGRQAVSLGVLAVVGALLARVDVRVVDAPDGRCLEVVYGKGVVRQVIPASTIDRVDVVDVSPWHWGGFGYRGSLRLLGRAALVTRPGPGLRVTLASGRRFVLTVDEPAAFADALRAA